jgi:hypothetical protein
VSAFRRYCSLSKSSTPQRSFSSVSVSDAPEARHYAIRTVEPHKSPAISRLLSSHASSPVPLDPRSRRRQATPRRTPARTQRSSSASKRRAADAEMASLLVAASQIGEDREECGETHADGLNVPYVHTPFFGGVSIAFAGVSVLCVVGTLSYMALEGLSFIDALYLSTGVITTVGLVLVPRTVAGRAFTAVFNVVSLGLGVLLLSEISESRRAWSKSIVKRGMVRGRWDMIELLASFSAMSIPVVAASFVFHAIEGWPISESLYFCLITASGLGMGDVEPRQWTSRLLFIAYLWYTMGVTLSFLGTMGHVMHEALASRLRKFRLPAVGTNEDASGFSSVSSEDDQSRTDVVVTSDEPVLSFDSPISRVAQHRHGNGPSDAGRPSLATFKRRSSSSSSADQIVHAGTRSKTGGQGVDEPAVRVEVLQRAHERHYG